MSGMLMEAVSDISRLSLTEETVLATDSRWVGSFVDFPFLLSAPGVMLLRLKMLLMKCVVLLFLLFLAAAAVAVAVSSRLRAMVRRSSKLLEVCSHAFPSESSSEALE